MRWRIREWGSVLLLGWMILGAGAALGRQDEGPVVTGRVADGETGGALAGAHVFVDGSTYGAVTNAEGRYRLAGLEPGSYDVVVSMVGYAPQRRRVDLVDGATEADFALQQRVVELGEVRVTAAGPEVWRMQLDRFEALFLGTSDFAKRCELVNPEVLSFADVDGRFAAEAGAPLIVENRALGYRVWYVLEELVEEGTLVRYRGGVRFEELEPRNRREARRWRRNREQAYEGSLRHLLRALAGGTADEARFRLYAVDTPDPYYNAEWLDGKMTTPGPPVRPRDLLFREAVSGAYLLQFDRYLAVVYGGEREARALSGVPGAATRSPQDVQVSWLTLSPEARSSGGARFDADGRLIDPYALQTFGAMAAERVAEFLPWDY